MRALLPGLGLLVVASAVSLLAAAPVPAVSALLVAVVLGAVLRNARVLPGVTVPGVVWWGKRSLRVGIVLLGLQLSVPAVLGLGWAGAVVVLVTVAVTFAATVLAGRVLGVDRSLTLLVATGFSICGAAAVAAMSAVLDPEGEREEDTATAVALVTLYGTVTLAVLPVVVGLTGMTDRAAGLWIGASVHEVAQVVAAGGLVSTVALGVATLTKLGRVVLLAPLVAGVGLVERRGAAAGRRAGAVTGRAAGAAARPPVLPLFVAGFLGAVLVRSTGLVPTGVLDVASWVTTALLTAAMVALGTGVDLRRLARSGGRATVLGAVATLVAVAVSGLLVVALAG